MKNRIDSQGSALVIIIISNLEKPYSIELVNCVLTIKIHQIDVLTLCLLMLSYLRPPPPPLFMETNQHNLLQCSILCSQHNTI